MSKPEPWWHTFYDQNLADMLLETGGPEEGRRTVSFVRDILKIQRGGHIFDQCCGTGRLALPLAEAGYHVTAVDLMESYIKDAQKKELTADMSIEFKAADAFSFICHPPCDAVLNWWTSFGYHEDDSRNLEMLLRAEESLRPGGVFALDFMNTLGVLHCFQPRMVNEGINRAGDRLRLLRESRIDVERGVLEKDWVYTTAENSQVRHKTRVRLYDPPQLKRLFEEAGFRHIAFYGDLEGNSLTVESPRCIIVGRKL